MYILRRVVSLSVFSWFWSTLGLEEYFEQIFELKTTILSPHYIGFSVSFSTAAKPNALHAYARMFQPSSISLWSLVFSKNPELCSGFS